jgi:hypothetical protein
MVLVEHVDRLFDVSSALLPDDAFTPRSGVHFSSIAKDIWKRMDPDRFGGEMDENRIALGLAMENLLAETLFRRRVDGCRPDPIERDGITCSPDWLAYRDWTLEEWKVTWMRQPRTPEEFLGAKFAHYHMQGKTYAHVWGTDRMRFVVFWVNGTYAPPVPDISSYTVAYTTLELQENWELLLTHGRDIGLLPQRRTT